jgi:hypothetical protein
MKRERHSLMMTVAGLFEHEQADRLKCLFSERELVFEVSRAGATRDLLREAFDRGQPVKATFDDDGNIDRIASPAESEIEESGRIRKLLEDPQPTLKIDTSEIDPRTFDIPPLQPLDRILMQKERPQHLQESQELLAAQLQKYMPIETTWEIFDFCASQSCHINVRVRAAAAADAGIRVTPCIPFQYAWNGCAARAYKMHAIIRDFGYSCEKVFAFAVLPDQLWVRADKWGKCCVGSWWYHAAPLVHTYNTQVPILFRAVIDPALFNQPVLLSTWLKALENQVCLEEKTTWYSTAVAKVTSYSIQSSSAYMPANSEGTAFYAENDAYTNPDFWLEFYGDLTTCH